MPEPDHVLFPARPSRGRRNNSSGLLDQIHCLIAAAPRGISRRMLNEVWCRPDIERGPMKALSRPMSTPGSGRPRVVRNKSVAPLESILRRLAREGAIVMMMVDGAEWWATPATARSLRAAA